MLQEVFTEPLGPSTGPDIAVFKRFQSFWPSVQISEYQPGIADPEIALVLQSDAAEMISFAAEQLQQIQPRDDYRELLELVILFLGGVPERGVHIYKPGELHRARFMAKLIYSYKVYLFRRSNFKLTNAEKRGLSAVCIFGIQVYVKSWFRSCLPAVAPANDLQLLKRLASIDTKPAKTAALVSERRTCCPLLF